MAVPLPGNATALERALTEVCDTRSRVRGTLPDVPRLTWDKVPDDWLPWVIEDEALDELLAFLPPRTILSDGRLWARERGSAQAIARALGWYGQSVTLHFEPDEDENFDLFQVELSSPVPPSALPDIIRLIRLSKPTTDVLARVFSGFDARPFRLDYSRLDGPDLLENWSGVRLDESGDVVVSFGATDGCCIELDIAIAASASHALIAGRVEVEDGLMLDVSKLDQEIVEPGVIDIQVAETANTVGQIDTRAAPWPVGAWPGHTWLDFGLEVSGGDNGNSAE